MTVLLGITFSILVALLLASLIAGWGGYRAWSAVLIGAVCWGFVVWGYIGSLDGWPKSAIPPARSVYVANTVREPNPSAGDPGRICLWVIENGHGGDPRAYCVKYSRQLHEQLSLAQAAVHHGVRVSVVRVRTPNGQQGQNIPKWAWRVQKLPQVQLPPKPEGQ